MSIRKLIVVCQCVEVIALAVWVGGLVSIIVAAIPAVINTMGNPGGVEAGGRLLTRTFHRYDHLSMVSAGFIIIGMLARVYATTGHWREQISLTEIVVLGTMTMIALYLTFFFNPQIAHLQELAFSAQDKVERSMAYQDFFFGHYIARALYMINLGLGIAVLCLKVKKWVR